MKQNSYSVILYTVVLGCLVSVYSCKKSKNQGTHSSVKYDFSFDGVQSIDDTLSFQSTAPAGSKFSWSFGDSTYSSDSTPVHIYENDGSFVVSLTVNNDTANTIQKTITITAPAGSGYTYNMSGIRKWHYFAAAHGYTIAEYDTSFAIQIINKITIRFGNDTMNYDYFDTSGGRKVLSFHTFAPPLCDCYFELNYFVDSDSMFHQSHLSTTFEELYNTFK